MSQRFAIRPCIVVVVAILAIPIAREGGAQAPQSSTSQRLPAHDVNICFGTRCDIADFQSTVYDGVEFFYSEGFRAGNGDLMRTSRQSGFVMLTNLTSQPKRITIPFGLAHSIRAKGCPSCDPIGTSGEVGNTIGFGTAGISAILAPGASTHFDTVIQAENGVTDVASFVNVTIETDKSAAPQPPAVSVLLRCWGDDKWGLLNRITHQWVAPKQYDRCFQPSEGFAAVCMFAPSHNNPETRCGFVNAQGNLVIPLQYFRGDDRIKDLYVFHGGRVHVCERPDSCTTYIQRPGDSATQNYALAPSATPVASAVDPQRAAEAQSQRAAEEARHAAEEKERVRQQCRQCRSTCSEAPCDQASGPGSCTGQFTSCMDRTSGRDGSDACHDELSACSSKCADSINACYRSCGPPC